jgi:hypothetical protein
MIALCVHLNGFLHPNLLIVIKLLCQVSITSKLYREAKQERDRLAEHKKMSSNIERKK